MHSTLPPPPPAATGFRGPERDPVTHRFVKAAGPRNVDRPEYSCWEGMRRRCFSPRDRRYASYGGRGITVCERWAASFEAFLADVGPRPSAQHSLDRKDNNGNYEPGNCRWATRIEQQNNRRCTRELTLNGETKPLTQWAREAGLPRSVLITRVKRGWPSERLLAPAARKEWSRAS